MFRDGYAKTALPFLAACPRISGLLARSDLGLLEHRLSCSWERINHAETPFIVCDCNRTDARTSSLTNNHVSH
jgi:hypothetical protein